MERSYLRGLALLGMMLAVSPAVVAAGNAELVDKAGSLRMLSQRVGKAYLMLGQAIQPERAREILAQSVDLFDKRLAALKPAAREDNTRSALAQLERDWQAMKPIVLAAPSRKGADDLYDASELVQVSAHRVTLGFEREGTEHESHLVNLAGRQRMLSQRLAKFYFYQSWDMRTAEAGMELKMARAEFASGLYQLAQARGVTPEIRAALEAVNREWVPYQYELTAQRDAAAGRKAGPGVAQMSERLLAACETVVGLFARQGGKP